MDPIILDHLSRSFGNHAVLDDISLSVKEGEIFGYLGPNGAGKTTTLRILLNILAPTSGTVTVLGTDVTAPEYQETRKEIGFVLENTGLYGRLTAAENLEFYDRIYNSRNGRRKRLKELLDLVGLADVGDQAVKSFSYGMRQRLALARALVGDPSLLILDEPSKSLDVEGRVMMRDLLLDLRREGKTIFLSSHDLDEVQRIASHVGAIRKGKMVLCDTCAALLTERPLVEVEIGNRSDALERLDSCAWITSWDLKENTVTIGLENLDDRGRISRLFADMGVDILAMRVVRRSLEEIYLDLVRDEEAEEDED